MYRAWPEGDVLVLAQVGEPVPCEHALGADHEVVAIRRDRLQERPGSGRDVAVQDGLAVGVQDAEVHDPGVQVDAAVILVLLRVEAHRLPSWVDAALLLRHSLPVTG